MPIGAKSSMWFAICNVAQRGVALLTLPIFTRMLSTQEYGLVSVFSSWESILSIILTLNLCAGVFVTAFVKFEDDKDRLMSSFVGLSNTVTIIFAVLYFLFRNQVNEISDLPTSAFLMLFSQLIVLPAFQMWSMEKKFDNEYVILIKVSIAISALTPLLGIFFVYFADDKGIAKILSATVIQIVICGVIYFEIIKRGKVLFHRDYWKYGFAFAIPLIPHYLSLAVLGQSDRIMISKYVGQDKAAIYSVAYNAASVISLFFAAINNSFGPWSVRRIKEKDYVEINKKIKIVLPGIVVLILIFLCFEPEIVRIFATEEYYEAIWVMPPITIGLYFTFINAIFLRVEFYYEMKYLICLSSCIAALLNIVLNAVFIPSYGYYAAGYTTMFCYMVLALTHYITMKYVGKKYVDNAKMFDIVFIIKNTLIVFAVSLVMLLLYNHFIIRYCVLILLLSILWFKRKIVYDYVRRVL